MIKEAQLTCGKLGGQGLYGAFGSAAAGLLPNLVASWVTGHHQSGQSGKKSEEIGGGEVTSTVIYCWMAAIVREESDGSKDLVCTGSLGQRNLVVTSAACAHESETGSYKN